VLKLGRSEMLSGGRRKEALLGDAMEAVIAAVYLDAGFEAARRWCCGSGRDRIAAVEADARDAKTACRNGRRRAACRRPAMSSGREGPDHAPVFTVEARLETGARRRAGRHRSAQAEQAAAKALLARMEATGRG
jgi:ribonuclease III